MRHFHYECCHSLSYSAIDVRARWLTDLPGENPPRRSVDKMALGLGPTGNQSQDEGKEKQDPAPIEPRREASIPDSGSQLSILDQGRRRTNMGRAAFCVCEFASWLGLIRFGLNGAGERQTGQADLGVRLTGARQETGLRLPCQR